MAAIGERDIEKLSTAWLNSVKKVAGEFEEHVQTAMQRRQALLDQVVKIKRDGRLSDQARAADERTARDQAQQAMAKDLQESKAFEKVNAWLALRDDYTPETLLRRATFADDPATDAQQRAAWGLTLPRMNLSELAGTIRDAVADKNVALAAAALREAQFRTRDPGAGDAERQTAREAAQVVATLWPPQLAEAHKILDGLSGVRGQLERIFSELGRAVEARP
jgi:hypothetical protein